MGLPKPFPFVAWACVAATAACTGQIGDPGADLEGSPKRTSPPEVLALGSDQAPSSALYRLSRREYESVLVGVFGSSVSGMAEMYLPPDALSPFDTDQEAKTASAVFVEGLESLAAAVARNVTADTSMVAELAGCTPEGPADETCMQQLVGNLGLRLWRRPLDDEEVSGLVTSALAFAVETGDFSVGARLVVQSLLQGPEFAYRTAIGTPDGDLLRLDNFELVARLSFLIWGTTPDPELLEAAQGPPLTGDDLTELAERMLADSRADDQIRRFHELWLGYRGLRVSEELAEPMTRETEALVDRVLVRERSRWSELFTSTTTFVDAALAAHYGMPTPAGGEGWVEYDNAERAGVLSHGSILSLSKQGTDESSPTQRGKLIATRLLCWTIPDPPADVDADEPPEPVEGGCKSDAYAMHRERSSACYGCHQLMDPIGFGLERFDALGRYRTHEYANQECEISGEGELDGIGTFNGPRELAELLISQGLLTECGVEQYLSFATGRDQSGPDEVLIARLNERFVDSGEDFRALVLALVGDPVFRFRVEESR